MSLLSGYTKSTKLPVEDDGSELASTIRQHQTDATRLQLIHNWKQSTITIELLDSVKKDIDELMEQSIKLAVVCPTNNEQIVKNLIRVDALRKLLAYGSTK